MIDRPQHSYLPIGHLHVCVRCFHPIKHPPYVLRLPTWQFLFHLRVLFIIYLLVCRLLYSLPSVRNPYSCFSSLRINPLIPRPLHTLPLSFSVSARLSPVFLPPSPSCSAESAAGAGKRDTGEKVRRKNKKEKNRIFSLALAK